MRLCVAFATILLLLAGCSSEPVRDIRRSVEDLFRKDEPEPAPRKAPAPVPRVEGEPLLRAGISQYDNGRYDDASRSLRLALKRGLSLSDQVTAHKYLAFIQCAAGREAQCREEFARALRIDPNMELAPAEAGHPIWGPVFREVKTGG
ncbi:MAG TPA: TssQ family T6SS-associated lipoprotein [Burkholderiales bacterium]|nr:TssQ family T6SS-associated lipoprotein [Burkholderiales bacterium]